MTDVVGSASFELRAVRTKISGDMEAAKKEVLEATKKTEAEIEKVSGEGAKKGAKKAADALKEASAAADTSGKAISAAMGKAGDDIGNRIAAGTKKAKAELDSLAAKAKQVQQVRLPVAPLPDPATNRLTTNPLNGAQSYVPLGISGISDAREARTNQGVAKAKAEIADLRGQLGAVPPAASAAAAGIAGLGSAVLGAAAAFAAIVAIMVVAVRMAFDLSFAALRMADDFSGSAKKIGVSTDALQEWRFVAKKSGEDAAAADQSLESFASNLAKATAGTSASASKAFNFIGLGRDELAKFKSTEEALDNVTDRIKELKNEADRAAVAEALGLGAFSASLRDSAVDVAALRDEAHELGVVMDAEMIRRATKAQEEFETLASVIDIQLKSAFIDLAPAIMGIIQLVAELATNLASALDQFRSLENKTARGLQAERLQMIRERDALILQYGSEERARGQRVTVTTRPDEVYTSARRTATSAGGIIADRLRPETRLLPTSRERNVDAGERIANLNRGINARTEQITLRTVEDAPPTRSNRPEGSVLSLPEGRTPRARVDRSAEREARRAERVEQDIFRAKQRLLQVAEGDLLNAQERADLARHIVNDERAARDAQIASQAARGEINEAELEQLNLANEQADILEDQIMRENALRDVLDEEVANRNALADLTANLVSLQIGAVRTAQERQRLELELLAITQRQRRDRLELELNNNPALSDAEKQQRWDLNSQIEQMERDAVRRANLSPLQQWRDEALKSAAEVSEAYEAVAANGLDALNEGIVDAIMGTKSLGEVFSQVAKQILADLLSISVRRGITEPLANALFGGGGAGGTGGGGGGFLSSIGSAIFGGLRGGAGGGGGGFSLPNILGNVLGKITGTSAAPASAGAPVSFDLRGAVMTSDLLKQMQGMASQSGGAALGAAKAVVPAEIAQTRRYTRG